MLDMVDVDATAQDRINALQSKCAWLTGAHEKAERARTTVAEKEAAIKARESSAEKERAAAEVKIRQLESKIEEIKAVVERRIREVEERAAARADESWPNEKKRMLLVLSASNMKAQGA